MKNRNKNLAFTLIELLFVISIIGLMASIIMVSLNSSREKARIAKAKHDTRVFADAAEVLATDTGKWPGGCPVGRGENPDMLFTGPATLSGFNSSPLVPTIDFIGLTVRPPSPEGSNPYSIHYGALSAGGAFPNHNSLCRWYPNEIAAWRGPYTSANVVDPWGIGYEFDMDYAYLDTDGVCRSYPAVLSYGPNKTKDYPCSVPTSDDIYVILGSYF